eukprot:196625-Hanusia_phi.AAC.1
MTRTVSATREEQKELGQRLLGLPTKACLRPGRLAYLIARLSRGRHRVHGHTELDSGPVTRCAILPPRRR